MLDPALAQRGMVSTSSSPPPSWRSLFQGNSDTNSHEQLEFVESALIDDVVDVPNSVIEEGVEHWSNYLVGVFVDKRMSFPLVKRTLKRAWKTKADYEISTR
ncbi:hypothetical protein IFM89_001056 [Coptis chinensis]|uniref:Uncharacterized protein n=1 Tax=Coptis chinensis TaxID=261450 RepID=A0A835LL59_9MAGN|nr:hypothetical protein IFM89_001056 [Coptis chinensis]